MPESLGDGDSYGRKHSRFILVLMLSQPSESAPYHLLCMHLEYRFLIPFEHSTYCFHPATLGLNQTRSCGIVAAHVSPKAVLLLSTI